jgi:predicted DsbA family dithiol-disulfide isomerase
MRVSSTLEELKKDYGDDLRIVWKPFVVHPQQATDAALAACAAGMQGKYLEFAREVWARGWPDGHFKDLSMNVLVDIATDPAVGLDVTRWKSDETGDKCHMQLQNDMAELANLGTRGTPTFYVNGRYMSGAMPIDMFKKLIDEEMAKADAAIKSGVKAQDYYRTAVVAKGKKSIP